MTDKKFASQADLEEKKISLKLLDPARELLAERGFDPAFGARPLKRTIQNMVMNELARKVLSGEVKEGNTVVLDAKNNELVFRVE